MAVGLWVALLALGLALLYNLQRRRPKLNLPPGPPSLPMLGNLPSFTSSKLVHHALADVSKQYGPLTFLHIGSKPSILASSPELFLELFKHQDQLFASRPTTVGIELCQNNGRGVAFAPYGEHWRQMRKVVTVELLTQKKIKEFESSRMAEASAMVRAILHHDKVHGTGQPVNLRRMLRALTFNFITQIAFSKRFYDYASQEDSTLAMSELEEEAMEFSHLIEEVNQILNVTLIGDFIPCLSFLDRLAGHRSRMVTAHKRLHEFLGRTVEEHRKHPKQANLDFVDVLLSLPGEDGSQHLDDVVIRAICQDVVSGGTDSSSSSLEWIMAEILKHPEVGAKVMAELDAVVGTDRLVTEADIPNLPYLQVVVKEGMRLHPAVPLPIPHFSLQHTKLMGYDIPQSSLVFANVWAVQRDPVVWDNPLAFRPERFLETPEIDVKGQHYQLLPFGAGRRGCPAMSLGLTTVQYGLARLLQSFEWSLPSGMKPADLDMEEGPGVVVWRAHVLEAVPTTRLSFNLYR